MVDFWNLQVGLRVVECGGDARKFTFAIRRFLLCFKLLVQKLLVGLQQRKENAFIRNNSKNETRHLQTRKKPVRGARVGGAGSRRLLANAAARPGAQPPEAVEREVRKSNITTEFKDWKLCLF